MTQSRPSLAVLNEDFAKLRDIKNTQETDSLINYLLTILNIKVSTEEEERDLKIQMLVVDDFLKSKFGYLTIPEIKEAFKMFVAREFQNIKVFRILDCVSIGEVLQAYTDFRNESLRNYSQKKLSFLQTPEGPTAEEKIKIREQFLKVVYEELKLNGFSNDAWHLFKELEDSGKLKISDFDKNVLYKQELAKYTTEQKEEFRKKGIAAKQLLIDFQKKIDSGKSFNYVKNRCRSITASNYLKKFLDDFETFKKAIEDEK